MCGSSSTFTSVTNPNRHQIRNAIRAEARALRKDKSEIYSSDLANRIMSERAWAKTTDSEYWTIRERVIKALHASTIFTHRDGFCGGMALKVRKTAKL